MQVLVLGVTGMLGHKLAQTLSGTCSVTGTVRGTGSVLAGHPGFSGIAFRGGVRADDIRTVQEAMDAVCPDVVVNCIGIVKQLPAAQDPLPSIAINALFPHQVARLCRDRGIRMIHISTDCVFSGRTGNYTESDPSDAEDLYGRTKYLGEVQYPGTLTLRTSIIGRELGSSHGLVEWFLGQEGRTVSGYRNAIFSGVTTQALSGIIRGIISGYPDLSGLVQVASEPISKFDLLCMIRSVYGLDIRILPDTAVAGNRSLNPEKFRRETNIKIPSWEYMIQDMYRDPTPYRELRGHHAQ